MKIAIIGTAGRDKTKPLNSKLWAWMLADAFARVPLGAHLVSGGAAWADHLAVELFNMGHAGELTLHLPAPFDQKFVGPANSSASAANFYHTSFSRVLGHHTLSDIERALTNGAVSTVEPARPGYGGLFARNLKVAKSDILLAYTFGPGDEPEDGGTRDTWNKHLVDVGAGGSRTHITLPTF